MAAPVLTQTELIQEIQAYQDDGKELSAAQIKDVLNCLRSVVEEQLSDGNRVRIPGLVTFEYRLVKAIKKGTMVMNPSKGEKVAHPGKPASVTAKATVPKPLKDAVAASLTPQKAKKRMGR